LTSTLDGVTVSVTPRPPYPQGKSPCYPFDRRLGGPQSRSERGTVSSVLTKSTQ